MRRLNTLVLTLATLLANPLANAANSNETMDGVVEQLKSLLETKQYAAAYKLGSKQNQWLGEAQFDFLHGIASLKSDNVHEAVFAFERVLNEEPLWQEARYHLAVSYYRADNVPASKSEIKRLQESPNLQYKISKALNELSKAIERKELSASEKFTHSLLFGSGYDSNVNAGSAEDSIFIPSLGADIPLSAGSQATESGYFHGRYTGSYSKLLNQKQKIDVTAMLGTNYFTEVSDFNRTMLSANGRFTYLHKQFSLFGSASVKPLWLGSELYRTAFGTSGGANYLINKGLMISASASIGLIKNSVDERLDSNTLGFAISATYNAANAQHQLSWSYADEAASDSDFDYHGKNSNSLSYQIQLPAFQYFTYSGAASLVMQTYHAEHPLFETVREESLFYLNNSLNYDVWEKATLAVNLGLQSKSSNVELYEYNRIDLGVTLNVLF